MILDPLNDLNWPAVAAAVAAAFAIGIVWFSPQVLGGFWARQVARYTGVAEAEITVAARQPRALATWLVGFAAAAVAMALSAKAVGADSASDGILLGLLLALGLGATFSSWPPVFARMPWAWWLVSNGAFLLMLTTMGAILGAWR
jgi:hypothetical protein